MSFGFPRLMRAFTRSIFTTRHPSTVHPPKPDEHSWDEVLPEYLV